MTSRAIEEVHERLSVIRAREHTVPKDFNYTMVFPYLQECMVYRIYSIRCCGVYSFQAVGRGRCLLEGGIQ